MQNHRFLLAVVIAAGTVIYCQAGSKKAAKEKAEGELTQLFETCFPRWDRDHNGSLSLAEINALIENPQVRGDEAAAVVVIRRHFAPKGEASGFQGLSLAELLAFANDREAVRSFAKLSGHIQSINHALFLPGDPNLTTFHQGGVGDCYLLSVVAALVNRDPWTVRGMIQVAPGGACVVHFGNGEIVTVSPVTDAELALGAREGSNHGIWLGVLENAYATVREEKRDGQNEAADDADDLVAKDVLGGGRAGPVISLFTGHKTASAPVGRWAKEDIQQAADRLHKLLIRLAAEHRLMAAGTGKNEEKRLPRHIPHGHVCAVVGYDSIHRIVRVFNPWGNDVMPSGPVGLVNGYITRDGIFEVPIQEFVQIFGALAYETE